jgi:hypothetical protein
MVKYGRMEISGSVSGIDARWKCVVSFTLQLFYLGGKFLMLDKNRRL